MLLELTEDLVLEFEALRHRLRTNTRRGSRRNNAHNYDIGNRFFELFLDKSRMYSSW